MTTLTTTQRKDIKTLLIIIAVLTAVSLTSCTNKHGGGTQMDELVANTSRLKQSDSVTYDMYRGYRVIGGDITPVYIPVKDSVFHATDTIRVNSFGTYDPNGTFRVVIGIYMGHVKFAKEE